MIKRIIFLASLSLCITSSLFSQENPDFHFRKIRVDEGLSENAVYCILQDKKGFIWFGTKDGLNRYDGSDFRIFRNSTQNDRSIGNNFIRSMIEGENGFIYIGTDIGLNIMDTREETFTKVTTQTPEGNRITSAVNALYMDRDSAIWIATMAQGLFKYLPKEKKLSQMKVKDNKIISPAWVIYEDMAGSVWVGTRMGLLRYREDTAELETVENMYYMSGNYEYEILSIREDRKGNFWLGTWSEGLKQYNKQNNTCISHLNGQNDEPYVTHIRCLLPYDERSLLVGSDDGLYLFDPDRMSSRRLDIPLLSYSMSDQNVYSMLKDQEGGIWIGSYFGGINYLNPSTLNMETYYPHIASKALSGKAVSQFCEDASGNLWIATEDGGVNYFNVQTKTITQPIHTSYHNTHALLLDGDDLWIGTFSRGIDIYNVRTHEMTNFRNREEDNQTLNDDCVFALYKTKKGEIYAGTTVGLNKFDKASRTFTRIPEVSDFIYDIKEDENENLWLATYGRGAMRLDVQAGKWIHYDTIRSRNNPITGSKLTGIYLDSRKRMLFSSEGKGIFIYDNRKDDFINISETEGLPNNVVYGILDDPSGNLWISCNKGLVRFKTSDPANYKLYDKEDGLQSNQFNYKSSLKTRDGKFYFGGINGFNSFFPQDVVGNRNEIIPPVEIIGVNLLGHSDTNLEKEIQMKVNKREKIILPHNRSSFTISYVSLSYMTPTKNQYAYRLAGADSQWNYVGNNQSVTYVNLSPGKYLFRVKGTNNEDVWNEEGTSIQIEIQPPFWLSFPAKIIYVLLSLLLSYILISWYLKKNKEKQLQILENYKIQQETLAFKSKIDFFTTIAHEIRTPLSLILAPLEEVLNSGEGSVETKQNLSIIEKNCTRLKELINQLLDFRKMDSTRYIINPTTVNLYDLIQELYDRFRKTAQQKGMDIELQMLQDKTEMTVLSDEDALTKIIGNLLTNALKYTRNKIIITLKKNIDHSFSVKVTDNGRGISGHHKTLIFDPFYQVQKDDAKIGTGLGLSLVKNLTEILGGTITVEDNPTGGTQFEFTFRDIPDQRREMMMSEAKIQMPEADSSVSDNSRHSILVVEDNPEMALFIRNSFQQDYHVDTASDADKALELLNENNYDIIVSDIMMPGTDGISFTKRLRSDLNYSHIPVILLSARTENAVKVEGLLSGADVFIEKPFSVSYLKAQIASLLQNRKTIQEAFNRSPLASYSVLVNNKNDGIFLAKLNEEIELHISDENFSVDSLTEIFNMSRSNLQRKLKSISGVTPGDYLRNYRLKKAYKLLLETDMRINEVAFRVGFNSPSYFAKVFYKTFHMLPKEFMQK
ncbi:MAG: response regulator [Tannerellaceae bacterium]|jgi:signal transduction histidine kinase/ligand-binding sensor domain-containing protein/DNA-binding response OmpR family regulator|nr:response regulator [Tannerellaceae bacterium]